jgi:hypothetical protein
MILTAENKYLLFPMMEIQYVFCRARLEFLNILQMNLQELHRFNDVLIKSWIRLFPVITGATISPDIIKYYTDSYLSSNGPNTTIEWIISLLFIHSDLETGIPD